MRRKSRHAPYSGPDLDRAIEAGLRQQARSEPCPSIDVIGAYCERSLAIEELTRWEDHFAGCRRCQQVLAAMARIEPALLPVSEPSWPWRALDWRWLVPATAAAAAVTIWIAVRPAPSRVEGPPPSQVEGPAPSRAVPAITPPQIVAQRTEPAVELQPPATAAPVPSGAAAVPQRTQELLAKPAERALPPPPPPAPAGRAVASAPPGGQPVSGVPETPPPAAAAGQLDTKALANRVDLAASAMAREGETGTIVIAAGSQVRWRVGARGVISRSEDGGTTWALQSVVTGQDLLAGSAPSDDVVWVVGRGGTILKTTDGRSWSRVDSPVSEDVVSVEATDAMTATIRTPDGQRFLTRDGGRSWERQQNLKIW